jgi:hypothetical protein
MTAPYEPSDEELCRAYTANGTAEAAEAFILIYRRYRRRVQDALEAAGLSAGDAEARVGEVFRLALEQPGDLALGARIERCARSVAGAPRKAAASDPLRFARGRMFGSGN